MLTTLARLVTRPRTKSVAFAAAVTVMALVVLEVAWRVLLALTGRGFFDDPREFTSPFFTTFQEPAPFVSDTQFEFRYGTVLRDKDPGEIRIICFGGSTTVNRRAGVSYTQVLEQRFGDQGDPRVVRVLNAGGEGYSTAHTLVNFGLRNMDVRPDIIVIYHNINDLSANWFAESIRSDYSNKYMTDFYLGLRHRSGIPASLAKMSRLVRFIVSKIRGLKFPAVPERQWDDNYQRGLEYFERNLRSIVALARAHGVGVVLASQAARSDFDHPSVAVYNAAVRRLAEEEGVVFVDVAAAMTDDALFLEDAIHYTRDGVQKIAEILFEPLRQMVEQVERPATGV